MKVTLNAVNFLSNKVQTLTIKVQMDGKSAEVQS